VSTSRAILAVLGLLSAACGDGGQNAARLDPFHVADSLRDNGLFRLARPRYRALRDSLAAAGDSLQLWRAELWWGYALARVGQVDSARAALETALALAGSSPVRQGWSRFARCQLWSRVGSDSAIPECHRALTLAAAASDGELEARLHFQLGTIHSRQGHFRQSVPETERALALERRHGRSPHQLAGTFNSMGIEYASVGRLGEAEEMYRKGLRLARAVGSRWYAFHLNSNLSQLRATSGDMDGALRLMTESLRDAEQLADTQGMVYALNSFAEYSMRAGNLAAARADLERARAINPRVAAYMRVITETDLGLLAVDESRLGEAVQILTRALALADAADFGRQRSQARVGLARVAIARGDYRAALRWANAAVAIAQSSGDPDALLEALEARAAALEAGRDPDAPQAYREGIDLLESWRGRLAVGDLRIGIAEPRWSLYEGSIRTLIGRGRAGDAFAIAERARARLLLEIIAQRDASQPAASLIESLHQELRARFAERGAVQNPAEQVALDREVQQLADSISALEKVERDRDPAARARYPRPATTPEVQAGLAQSGAAVLAFFWGDRAVYGWWITDHTVRAARLGAADSLAELVTFLRLVIEQPDSAVDWRPAAHRVYRALVAPLAPTPAQDVFVLSDGPLTLVPLDVLLPAPDSAPWGATRRITVDPSASILLALTRERGHPAWERTMLAVGGPTGGEPDVAEPELDPGTPVPALVPLPYAVEEARAIHEMFHDDGADLLVGRQATPARWLAYDPSRYRYLHFAAHARVSDRRPERTHLVLSDGGLDLAAIRRLRLHAELVTLSACETALGRSVRGEGIIGLPHAFLAAGARGAIVTLWQVGDRSASDFMRDFYAALRSGRPPADALAFVRRKRLAQGGAAAHPSHWAAFILVGGNRN
jgi:CHAT domain-containing protein